MKLLVAGATYGIPATVPITGDTPQRPINPNGRSPGVQVFDDDYPTPDGTCIRDYIHGCVLADAHVLGLQHLLAGGGQRIFNLGISTGYSVQQVLDVAQWRSGDPPALVASTEKAQLELGWPLYPALETIIEHAWNWHQPISGVQSG